jgi:periplasmic protein TonB
MPRDLFGDVTAPSIRVGGRKWYTVPLSLVAHTVAIVAIAIVPLLATGALPIPHNSVAFTITPLEIPAPPPMRRATSQPEKPAPNPNLAPVEPPATIEKERDFEPFENTTGSPVGVEGIGVVTGVESVIAPPPPPAKAPPPPQEPVRPGGNIRQPVKVRHVAPDYPQLAQIARVEGMVIIEATIAIDGRVQNTRVMRGHPMLDEAALAAVRQWMFTPTTLNGVPVAVIMTVTVHFQLNR